MTILAAGVDVGSLTTKAVVVDGAGRKVGWSLVESSPHLAETGREALDAALGMAGATLGELSAIVGTGYGRAVLPFATKQVTEITCHAMGAARIFPGTRLVVDVGGQDSKAIRLGNGGDVLDFAMNDKCAAGTGKFLNAMAATLRTGLDGLGPEGLKSRKQLTMSSTCTVFAESEVISLIAQGESVPDIVHAVHRAMAKRLSGLVRLVGAAEPAVFSGGVALNVDLVRLLEEALEVRFSVPDQPQLVGALGAAVLAMGTK
jgi:predicted CoA-substrate-specific enzyme activase